MKRLALAAVVLSVAACTTKETKTETTPADSAATMAPAPATTDTAMKMGADTTMKHDSTSMKAGMKDTAHVSTPTKKP